MHIIFIKIFVTKWVRNPQEIDYGLSLLSFVGAMKSDNKNFGRLFMTA